MPRVPAYGREEASPEITPARFSAPGLRGVSRMGTRPSAKCNPSFPNLEHSPKGLTPSGSFQILYGRSFYEAQDIDHPFQSLEPQPEVTVPGAGLRPGRKHTKGALVAQPTARSEVP
jgi:hypothetical protein